MGHCHLSSLSHSPPPRWPCSLPPPSTGWGVGGGLLAAACTGRRAEVPVEGDRLGSKETPLTF